MDLKQAYDGSLVGFFEDSSQHLDLKIDGSIERMEPAIAYLRLRKVQAAIAEWAFVRDEFEILLLATFSPGRLSAIPVVNVEAILHSFHSDYFDVRAGLGKPISENDIRITTESRLDPIKKWNKLSKPL